MWRRALFLVLISDYSLALSVHLLALSEAVAMGQRRTPQPPSSERPRAQKTRAEYFRSLWPVSAPRAVLGSLAGE